MRPTIFVVGTGTPPTTKQISVTVKYKLTTDGTASTTTVSNSDMSYTYSDGVKYVFNNEKYDWFGTVGSTSMAMLFVGFG